ncbi:MAG TPA: urate oxidase [Chthoniobacterales bacterium]|jgi:urate oxidase|nr:urate oxidase [Chthoniobacterales bacterium]
MPKLTGHHYGKARVRVLKIMRDGPVHSLKDLDVAAYLKGDFESSYTSGDNTKVVATDTIKNTVNVLAQQHLGPEIERFGLILAEHFLSRYEQVAEAEVRIAEKAWERLTIDGQPHPHAFKGAGDGRMFAQINCDRTRKTVRSGIRDLVILKSTGSGFENYPKDEFTTLPETSDRILATSFSSTWTFETQPDNYSRANEAIMAAMLKVFANNYSPSAQTTLFQMGEAALAACPEISELDLAMPNKHCLLINLAPFGLENKNELFVPTDEPHGDIRATVVRHG